MEKHPYDCLIHHKLMHQELIKGPVVSLSLVSFYTDKDKLPYYLYRITLGNIQIGKISLRLGVDEYIMLEGHIGYDIDEAYQGHHYAYYALELIKTLAKAHGYQKVLITMNPQNQSSIKTVLKAHGKLISPSYPVTPSHIYYVLGYTHVHVYEITL